MLNSAEKVNGTVYLNFGIISVSISGTAFTKAGLMSSNKPAKLTPVIIAPGGNSTPTNVQGYIDATGQLVLRSGGTTISNASYNVMAIYRV